MTDNPNRLLTRAEVEVIYGLSRRFLELAAIKGGGPPMVKIGRSVRYRVADLDAFIQARTVASTSQAVPVLQ